MYWCNQLNIPNSESNSTAQLVDTYQQWPFSCGPCVRRSRVCNFRLIMVPVGSVGGAGSL